MTINNMTPEEVNKLIDERLSALIRSDRFTFEKLIQLLDGRNIQTGKTTGTKFPQAADQKWGAFGVTPVVQQATIANADGTLADITTKFNTLLAQVEALGFNASS